MMLHVDLWAPWWYMWTHRLHDGTCGLVRLPWGICGLHGGTVWT